MDLHTSPLCWKVIGCAIEVHRVLGPGLLESSYETSLAREFGAQGLRFGQQVSVPGSYKGESLGRVYRVDFVVEDELVIEIKASNHLIHAHRAQLRTYLRLLGLRQGLVLNFNLPRLIDGLFSVLLAEEPTRTR